MRVLLGQSYFLRFDPKLCEAMQPYPPLGTLYAAAVLRERGHDVAFFDAMLADVGGGVGRRRWTRTARTSRCSSRTTSTTSRKMCLLRMREAAFAMIEDGPGARLSRRSCAAATPPTTPRATSTTAPTA